LKKRIRCTAKCLYNKTKPDEPIFQIYSDMKLYMFRQVPLSIIRSLFTVHSAMVYVIQVCRQLSSRARIGKLVHLVGFIIKKFVTMCGHMNVKFVNAKQAKETYQNGNARGKMYEKSRQCGITKHAKKNSLHPITSSSSSFSLRVRCLPCSLVLKVEFVPPSLLLSSNVPSSFWSVRLHIHQNKLVPSWSCS